MTIYEEDNTTKQQYNITTIQQQASFCYIIMAMMYGASIITTIQQHASCCYIIMAMMYGASIITF
jgi:hypothetical protein